MGLALACMNYGFRVWVADSLPDEAGADNDTWLSPEAWVDREAGL